MPRQFWTPEQLQIVRWIYPHVRTADLAAIFNRTERSVYCLAKREGLHKTSQYLASPAACRLRGEPTEASIAHRFQKGLVPHNKGLRRPGYAPGRMSETQFKRGERSGVAARNYRAIGTVLTDSDGYLRIKVKDAGYREATGFGNVQVWPLMQRHVWQQANGPVPAGHTVVFRDGNRKNCDLSNLELITRAELMRRNTIHTRYPKELVNVIMLNGALKRKIRRRNEELAG